MNGPGMKPAPFVARIACSAVAAHSFGALSSRQHALVDSAQDARSGMPTSWQTCDRTDAMPLLIG
jgi:hypothetical protein